MFFTKLLVYPMTLLAMTQGLFTVPSEIYSRAQEEEIISSIFINENVNTEIQEMNDLLQETIAEETTTKNKIIVKEETTHIEEESEVVIKEEESSEIEQEEETLTLQSNKLVAEFSETTTVLEEKTTKKTEVETTTVVEETTTQSKKEDTTEKANSTSDLYNPFKVTNYSAETFNKVLEGTYMEGYGQYLVNLEKEYGVNGMFCLGVARAESGMGSSNIAKNKNNYFGIMGSNGAVTYSSGEECIMSFGRLMNKSIYYGKTIEQIGAIYCESYRWPTFVRECMAYNFRKLS